MSAVEFSTHIHTIYLYIIFEKVATTCTEDGHKQTTKTSTKI